MNDILLEVKGIRKSFDQNEVLKGIDMQVKKGEVHVILGENGAGKSTLIKILTGVHPKDAGEIYWEGKRVEPRNPTDSINLGISTIYQELNNVQELKVYENIFLGREKKRRGKYSFIDRGYMRKEAIRCLETLGQDGKALVDKTVGELGLVSSSLLKLPKRLHWKRS